MNNEEVKAVIDSIPILYSAMCQFGKELNRVLLESKPAFDRVYEELKKIEAEVDNGNE